MRAKKSVLTNFSRSATSESMYIRPDKEQQLLDYMSEQKPTSILARGAGLSYSDCCLNHEGIVVDTQQFNHFIDFNEDSGIVLCQGGITFQELLHLHPEFLPPVVPGTLHATLAGGLANDIHGKNNHQAKSLGHHIEWLELLIKDQIIHCSKKEHSELFHATIGGLGLTGIITRLALRLQRTSKCVQVENEPFYSLEPLLDTMQQKGLTYTYQVAWLDLLNTTPRAILSLANHCPTTTLTEESPHALPKRSLNLIKKWNIKLFNQYYFHHKKPSEYLSFSEFNNPLDKLKNWNYLYGKQGMLQFQTVVPADQALDIIEQLIKIINHNKAVPTLAVLKLFTHSGAGWLSFPMPGFTLAIDFINNKQAHNAIKSMNQLTVNKQSRVYLAKDLLLTPEQYQLMYKHHAQFSQLLNDYQSPMHSDLALRLGIKK